MVSRSRMLSSALKAYRRWRTVTSMAMLRALGWPVGVEVGETEHEEEDRVDPETSWCFANHGSPMDGRF